MTMNAGAHAIKALDKRRDAGRARQAVVRDLQRQWVLDGEMTAEQLIAHHRRLRSDFYARHPELAGGVA